MLQHQHWWCLFQPRHARCICSQYLIIKRHNIWSNLDLVLHDPVIIPHGSELARGTVVADPCARVPHVSTITIVYNHKFRDATGKTVCSACQVSLTSVTVSQLTTALCRKGWQLHRRVARLIPEKHECMYQERLQVFNAVWQLQATIWCRLLWSMRLKRAWRTMCRNSFMQVSLILSRVGLLEIWCYFLCVFCKNVQNFVMYSSFWTSGNVSPSGNVSDVSESYSSSHKPFVSVVVMFQAPNQ